jgi:hypothetical protein
LYINKTSGSGNAATIIGTLNATTLVKSGGTSSQFLKADGSVDSTTYVGGSGATGQVAYWNGTSSQTGSSTLTYTPTTSLLVNNSVTAASAVARGVNLTPTLVAAANNDVLVGLDVNPTFTNGAFTGVSNYAARIQGALFISKNHNNTTSITIENTTSGTSAQSVVSLFSDSVKYGQIGKRSTTTTAGKIIAASDTFIYNSSGSGDIAILNDNSTGKIKFSAGGSSTAQATLTAAGRLLLGTTDEGLQRLQVQGDAFIRGTGTTSATTALLVTNSVGSTILQVRNDNYVLATNISVTSVFSTNYYTNGTGENMLLYGGSSGTTSSFVFNTYGSTDSALSNDFVRMSRVYNPTSGVGIYNTLLIGSTINQTGGANGITRGLYVNPTLTAAADWRSIEWSNNSGWGLYGAGTAPNWLGGNLTVSRNQNAATSISITNTTSGSSSVSVLVLTSDASSGVSSLGKYSSTSTPLKILNIRDAYLYNNTAGDIAILNDVASGKIKLAAGGVSTAQATLTASGRFLLGTESEGTFLLDVNGTARVSGAMNISVNQNLDTTLTISNTTSGTSAVSQLLLTSNSGAGVTSLAKRSSTTTNYKILTANNTYLYNDTAGDIAILNDFSSGNIKFAAGGSSTAHMTIKSNGRINMSSLPTSSVGLSSGDLWNNLGILSIA